MKNQHPNFFLQIILNPSCDLLPAAAWRTSLLHVCIYVIEQNFLHVDVITRLFAHVQWIHGFTDNRYDIFMLKTFFIIFAMRRLFIMCVVSLNSVILTSIPEEVPNGDSRSSLNSSG